MFKTHSGLGKPFRTPDLTSKSFLNLFQCRFWTSMFIFDFPTAYYWTSMSILNCRNSLRRVWGRRAPAGGRAGQRRFPKNSGHLADPCSNMHRNQISRSGNPSLRLGLRFTPAKFNCLSDVMIFDSLIENLCPKCQNLISEPHQVHNRRSAKPRSLELRQPDF